MLEVTGGYVIDVVWKGLRRTILVNDGGRGDDDIFAGLFAVDIRYVLFVIDKLGGAQRLINEMTINEQ